MKLGEFIFYSAITVLIILTFVLGIYESTETYTYYDTELQKYITTEYGV